MKRFYVYAGFYEIHIARHKLPAPFVYISKHNRAVIAVRAAWRFDSDAPIIAYEDSVDALSEAMCIDKESLIVA